MSSQSPLVLIRGGGDLATGVAFRLWRTGLDVVVTEVAQPLAVRRLVALAEAVYAGEVEIEDQLKGLRVDDPSDSRGVLRGGGVPVLVDPEATCRAALQPVAIIDGRMRKRPPEAGWMGSSFTVGLGPGFTAGQDCHAVVETNRGHHMGRVYWRGQAEADTGIPETVSGYDVDRVLRAPCDGLLTAEVALGEPVKEGGTIAHVGDDPVTAPFDGVLRGLVHDGIRVSAGMKIGDLDPRGIPEYCRQISDKSLAVGGGVLEALLAQTDIRERLGG